ncbi:hypothetical protein K7432_010107 [Basidiobolus ranarum]|uniref:Uncharacterized protein n=1 Tax=Basidiobolus ranarum TaxID=34480 RepID=A0ABR2WPB7_9FUNG
MSGLRIIIIRASRMSSQQFLYPLTAASNIAQIATYWIKITEARDRGASEERDPGTSVIRVTWRF